MLTHIIVAAGLAYFGTAKAGAADLLKLPIYSSLGMHTVLDYAHVLITLVY